MQDASGKRFSRSRSCDEPNTNELGESGFDAALEQAGSWGPWQKKFFLYASTAQMFTAMHAVGAGKY